MIKLAFQPRPPQLTDEKVAQLTLDFKTTGKAVWNTPYIKAALLKMSHGKCCYCECKIDEESKYIEIEHFHAKGLYKDDVLRWRNLLPCCKRCNGYKSDFDTKTQPIVHPVLDTPNEHFYFKNYQILKKTTKASLTIEVLQLNDRQRVVKPRFNIGSILLESLRDLLKGIKENEGNSSMFKRKFFNLLFQGNDTEEYAALCATIILESEDYQTLKTIFKTRMWWTSEMDDLEGILCQNALLHSDIL